MEVQKIKTYYNPNIKFDRIALTQVYEILKVYEDNIETIPEDIIRLIEDNRDKDYIFFDMDDLENAELLPDAARLLTYIYTEYLSSPEEHEVLKKLEKVHHEKHQNQIKEKYDTDVFKERKERQNKQEEELVKLDEMQEEVKQEELPVEYKESFFKKIINKIKSWFNH